MNIHIPRYVAPGAIQIGVAVADSRSEQAGLLIV
jgi:hypothetical protein